MFSNMFLVATFFMKDITNTIKFKEIEIQPFLISRDKRRATMSEFYCLKW